ncbi:P-loop containing nucleoside triphosphate hydrolase superfamily protein [Forsythia ovata]|uniref:P-loop containing nucleoside triphosphate hydrolase superfamily protein n=1 Tax=Forsythia ovata TaxID=205694 RepID=A0ABD1RL79_9LAMI
MKQMATVTRLGGNTWQTSLCTCHCCFNFSLFFGQPCARANGCIFDHRKFLIACTNHRHLFQPHGSQNVHSLKKMKAKKMKLEIKKMSNDARHKDVKAKGKWLENYGEDEEFLRHESKRLHRDLLRIAPVYIGGTNSENDIQVKGWESVAGLQDVI